MNLYKIKIPILALLLSITTTLVLGQQNKQPDSAFSLSGYSVHLVQPAKPYKFRNDKNEITEKKTAYLIFFDLKNRPAFLNTKLDFYIGEYKIPEYGGTKNGIYFRIYDKDVVSKLNNQPILYQIGKQQKKPFTATFKLPEAALKAESEMEVMKKNGR